MQRVCLVLGLLSSVGHASYAVSHFPKPVEQWVYEAGEPVTGECELFPNAHNPTHVLVPTIRGEIHCVDGNGKRVWSYDLGGAIRSRPAVGDLTGDGSPEIVVGTSEGRIVALSTENGPKEICMKEELSLKLTGPARWGRNELAIAWPAQLPEQILVEVSIGCVGGWTTTRVDSYQRNSLPSSIPAVLEQAGRNHLCVTLWEEKSSTALDAGQVTVVLDGFGTFEDSVKVSLKTMEAALAATIETAPKVAAGLAARHAVRTAQMALAKQHLNHADSLVPHHQDTWIADLDQLKLNAQRDARLAVQIQSLASAGVVSPVLAWLDPNSWDEAHPLDELDTVSTVGVKVAVPLYRNEVEFRVVNLVNLSSEAIYLQCRLAHDSAMIELGEVVPVPRRGGPLVDDALPRLNEAQTILLSPGQPRKLWLRCNSHGLEAGKHSAEIEILPLMDDAVPLRISVLLDVTDIDLSEAPEFLFCNWASPHRLQDSGFDLADIRRAVNDGMTLIPMSGPAFQLDRAGNFAGQPNWDRFDEALEVLDRRCFLLLHWSLSAPKELSLESDTYMIGLGKAMRALAAHLRDKGWPLKRWALYPVDEPGLFQGQNMQRLVEIATRYKKAVPEIQVYANPAGGVTVESFAEIKKLCDVWSPELGLLIRQPELVPFFKEGGQRVFCYEAPNDAKSLRPLGYYRGHCWLAFQLGLEGGGYWAYYYDDLWKSHTETEYGANYGTAGILVHSRRWEATRDGIEDVRAFLLLEKLANEAEASGTHTDVVIASRELLKKRVPQAIKKSYLADDISRNLFNYDPDYQEIQAIRKLAGKLTLELLGKKQESVID